MLEMYLELLCVELLCVVCLLSHCRAYKHVDFVILSSVTLVVFSSSSHRGLCLLVVVVDSIVLSVVVVSLSLYRRRHRMSSSVVLLLEVRTWVSLRLRCYVSFDTCFRSVSANHAVVRCLRLLCSMLCCSSRFALHLLRSASTV